jgi:hypothetical protein
MGQLTDVFLPGLRPRLPSVPLADRPRGTRRGGRPLSPKLYRREGGRYRRYYPGDSGIPARPAVKALVVLAVLVVVASLVSSLLHHLR